MEDPAPQPAHYFSLYSKLYYKDEKREPAYHYYPLRDPLAPTDSELTAAWNGLVERFGSSDVSEGIVALSNITGHGQEWLTSLVVLAHGKTANEDFEEIPDPRCRGEAYGFRTGQGLIAHNEAYDTPANAGEFCTLFNKLAAKAQEFKQSLRTLPAPEALPTPAP